MNYPIKISWKTEALPLAIIAIAIITSFYFYAHYPDMVVTHWNFRGEPDGFSPKTFASFFFPALLAGMYALFLVMPLFDPRRERYAEFAKVYNIFRNLILVGLGLIYLATGLYNIGYNINIGIVTATVIGLMMVILGNYMGKIKKNWFVGIRTPWTLSSENVWNKTHRLGGILFMIFGALLIVMPYMPEQIAIAIFIFWIIVLVIGTMVYSLWLYKKEKKLGSNNQNNE